MRYLSIHIYFVILALLVWLVTTPSSYAQYDEAGYSLKSLAAYNVIEIPFIIFAAVMGFLVARKFFGGAFGNGMMFIALGLFVMVIGHIHIEVENITGISILGTIFGDTGGDIMFLLTLILTWLLSGIGFYKLLKI